MYLLVKRSETAGAYHIHGMTVHETVARVWPHGRG
jgi:hypothetical protein